MDLPAFASLAQLRILLIPVGNISRETFDGWAALIRTVETIRLGDIPVDNRDDRARFMPSPLSTGHLHVSFPSHPPPLLHDSLSLFRPSAFPMGVIGVATCSQDDSLATIHAQFNAAVRGLFPYDSPYRSMYPLARNCFVFEDGDGGTNLNLGEQSGLVVIPSLMGKKEVYVGTLLADLCSTILGEFATIVQTLESPVGNEYLNSTMFPVVPSSNELPVALVNDMRNSMPQGLSNGSHLDLGSISRRSSLTLKRSSSASTGVTSPTSKTSFRQSTLLSNATGKKKPIGAASSHGRLFKVLGDLFLLAGRTEDAVVWYTEAIHLCKSPADLVWQGAALEGLAVVPVVDAWSSGHGLNASFSASKGQWESIADRLTQAASSYARAPAGMDADAQMSLIAYLFTSCVTRHTMLLLHIWAAKGWGPLAFAAMLAPGPSPALPPTLSGSHPPSLVHLERLTAVTGITRHDISTVLGEGHGPWLLHIGPRQRVAALEAMAGIYACLGYKRKEAYVLREVLGCIMDLVVVGREDPAERDRRASMSISGTQGLGIQGVPGVGAGTLGVRDNEGKDGNDSILRIVKYVCKVHGIDLEAVKLLESAPEQKDDDAGEGADEEEETDPTPFGWPELQVGIVREALAVAEALPDYSAVAQFSLSALKTLHPLLTSQDQQHLYATASRALATAKRRGERSTVDYWSGKPIVSIEVTPLPFARLPSEKPMSSLSSRTSNPILPKGVDPFLYNPRRAVTAKGQMTVVQNENVEVIVTLRNPYVFDLEIHSLSLRTSGVAFQHKPTPCLVPPNSFHPVVIIGKVLESGTLTISGCEVQAPGGLSRTFLLPIVTEEEDDKQTRRRSTNQNESMRHKYGGLASRPWEIKAKRLSDSGAGASSAPASSSSRYLECVVVPEQPLLRIRRTTLTHGAVMLYNGEKSSIRLTIENVSNLPVDFVKITFDDNTIAPAQQALADGELSVFDTYETEYDLIHRPAFSSNTKEDVDIKPGEKKTIVVNCLGRAGCTSGSIQLSYSHIHRKRESLDEPPDVFHTRHLSYPVLVTVYHMLECYAMDILPCPGFAPSTEDPSSAVDATSGLLNNLGDGVGWCMFSVEVRNTYGLPFDVTFERHQEGTAKAVTTGTVAPGSTCRLILPLKRFRLSEEQLEKPIPTLSDRQFVVDKTGMSSSEARLQRELFWYREDLFKCVRARWQESGGLRSGELFLRRQRMTLPMLETLRTETARVRITLEQLPESEDPELSVVTHDQFSIRPNRFCALKIQVTNLSYGPLTLSVDVGLEPAEHVVFEGSITGRPLGSVESNTNADLVIPVCFVSSGQFECMADVRTWDSNGKESWAGGEKVVVNAQDG